MNSVQDIRPEEYLLLKLCRLRFNDALKDEAESICMKEISWDYFARSANRHGISAIIYRNLESLELLKYVPEANAEFLRKASYLSMARNAGNMKMMSDVLNTLGKENIRIVLLKGMALELMVYGNRGLRQMTDADVLLQPDESMKAFRLLRKNGFRPLPVKSVFHKLILKDIGKHLPSLIKEGFSLEIHHELFSSVNRNLTSKFFQASTRTDFDGRDAWLPEPGMLFLYLVNHLQRHEANNDSQLRLYTDLVVLIDHYGDSILNPELLKLSEEAGMNQILADHLVPIKEYWHIPLPDRMNEFIIKNSRREATSRFIFFLKSPKNNPEPERSQSYRPMLKQIPGIHKKFIYVIGDLLPTIHFMKKRYHCRSGWKAMLYYPHRLGKLVWLFRK